MTQLGPTTAAGSQRLNGDTAVERSDASDDEGGWSPLTLSLVLANGYCVLCALYIVLSTRGAAAISENVPQLAGIELLKGLSFVLLTGGLFFGFAWIVFSRFESHRSHSRRQQRLMVDVDQRALAGLFAGSIAHDINNLLTVAQCQLSEIAETVPLSETRVMKSLEDSLGEIAKLSMRLAKIGQQQPRGDWSVSNAADGVRRAIEISRHHRRVRQCMVISRLEPVPSRSLNLLLLTRAVINLILNAAEATNGRGRVEVRLFNENHSIVIEVHDNGPGVPDESAQAVFEEFFTTKPDGTGLGLVVVSVCAREHGGKAEVRPSPLGGACFRMTFADR
jgi:signal transduction histidine kinase